MSSTGNEEGGLGGLRKKKRKENSYQEEFLNVASPGLPEGTSKNSNA